MAPGRTLTVMWFLKGHYFYGNSLQASCRLIYELTSFLEDLHVKFIYLITKGVYSCYRIETSTLNTAHYLKGLKKYIIKDDLIRFCLITPNPQLMLS